MAGIMLILLDDARHDALEFMPFTRNMAQKRGAIFTNAYANFPLCGPNRTIMMTGQQAWKSGVTGNMGGDVIGTELLPYEGMLGPWMATAGYDSIMVGKWGIGPQDIPLDAGWTRLFQNVASDDQEHYNLKVRTNSGLINTEGWYHDVQKAAITDHVDSSDGDWFVYWATSAPHWPFAGAKVRPFVWSRTKADVIPPQDGTGWPPWITERDPYANHNEAHSVKVAQARECWDLDHYLKSVWQHLVDTGEAAETTVIITSDNGRHVGDHRCFGPGMKNTLYQQAVRVPLAMWGPSIPFGIVSDIPVSSVDVTATCIGIADLSPTRTPDGTDLRTILENPTDYDDRAVFVQRSGPELTGGSGPGPSAIGVVTKTDKLIKHLIQGTEWEASNFVWEGYRIAEDPHELTNVADSPEWADTRSDLEAILDTMAPPVD